MKEKKIMSYIISRIILTILIPIALLTSMKNGMKDFINSHCYDISEDTKKELLELLEIEDAPSFKYIHKKRVSTYCHFNCYELKFEISKQDYEKNELKYGESWQEIYFACHYIEKESNGTYTCVVRYDDIANEEFYKRLRNIKIEWDKK